MKLKQWRLIKFVNGQYRDDGLEAAAGSSHTSELPEAEELAVFFLAIEKLWRNAMGGQRIRCN